MSVIDCQEVGKLNMPRNSYGNCAGLIRDYTPEQRWLVETHFKFIADLLAIVDRTGKVLVGNAACCAQLGVPADVSIAPNIQVFWDTLGCISWAEAVLRAFDEGEYQTQAWFVDQESGQYPVLLKLRTMNGENEEQCLLVSSSNITDLFRAKSQLELQANQDPLTGLFNRRFIENRGREVIASASLSAQIVGLIVLDLDAFKAINDAYGHVFGDKVICHVADLLRDIVPLGETLARLGGDEFVILLEDAEHEGDVMDLAEDIRRAITIPFSIENETIKLNSSIGVSIYPECGASVEAMISNADTAMFRSKQKGKNRVSLHNSTGPSQVDRRERSNLLQELLTAIERDEIEPYFQPLFSHTSDAITGAEVLCRWHHPERGVLYPQDFIPLAEHSGLIDEIDRLIVRKTCKTMSGWRNCELSDLAISVNVSAATIGQTDFVRFITSTLDEYRLSPDLITVELTESMVLSEDEAGRDCITRLAQLGIAVALDDFGTGFSSLALLKEVPVARLKIDKSFIQDLNRSERDKGLVRSVVALGDALGATTVAEGVETEEQAELVKSMGCTYSQGFLFGKAVPVSDFERTIAKARALS